MFKGQRLNFKDWGGLNTFGDPENLDPNVWRASENVVLGPTKSAVVLRSPLSYTDAIASSTLVRSIFLANYSAGRQILFDVQGSGAVSTHSVASTGGTPGASLLSTATGLRWKRVLVNDSAHGVNGNVFKQILSGGGAYDNGITPPAAAPTVSFVAGGSGSFAVGVTVSYAYRNSTTTHVSAPSAVSAASGASTNPTLRTAVTASTQPGVDGIVLFITVDAGSVRYLLVNSSGSPQVYSNATGNIDVSIANIFWDTNTPETTHNKVPPTDFTFLFAWKDRLFGLKSSGSLIQYSGYEAISYGVPYESWPTRNFIRLPNENDKTISGIATQLGALILGEMDSYLISGYPPDRITGPQAILAVSEHIEPLNWGIGTLSPFSLTTTPFGEIWIDQYKRIQLWDHSGPPVEIGLPIRDALLSTTGTNLQLAEGAWASHGELGGQYLLAIPSTGTFVITITKDPESGRIHTGCAKAAAVQSVISMIASDGTSKVVVGKSDAKLYTWFDPDTQGSGWTTEERYFEFNVGNETEFAYFHSLRFDAPNVTGLTLTVMEHDGTDSTTITPVLESEGGSAYYGMIDRKFYRARIKFAFDTTDTSRREIKNLRVFYKPTGRQN